MNSYLVQATCSGGLTPNNCAYAYQTKDLITTPLTFRRLDWPGAYSGIVSDNVLDPSTRDVLDMATRNGAMVLGLRETLGRIAPGQLAD